MGDCLAKMQARSWLSTGQSSGSTRSRGTSKAAWNLKQTGRNQDEVREQDPGHRKQNKEAEAQE